MDSPPFGLPANMGRILAYMDTVVELFGEPIQPGAPWMSALRF